MSTVYFANTQAKSEKDSLLAKTAILFDKLHDEKPLFKPQNLVGIKTHFGELGLDTFLSPVFSRVIIEKIKEKKANPFLFDTSTLYASGRRTNAVGHITTAIKNGFSYATLGAPIIIADGLKGDNFFEVEINQKHFKKIKIASDIQHMDAIICLSHFKGHCAAGFGGSLKTISMGMAPRAGKLQMHSQSKPFVTTKCTGCGTCVTVCPVGAITINPVRDHPPATSGTATTALGRSVSNGVKDKKAQINSDICIGCMRCDTGCPVYAIKFHWNSPETTLMEKLAEYALGFLKIGKDKTAYFNFLLEITPDCDCYAFSNAPIVENIGVLASFDPLAIDQASVDLVNEKAGKDIFRQTWPNSDYQHILNYAEKIGIGKRKYDLVKLP